MHGKENLYYAMGEMAYAVAKSDGKVQKEEHDKIQEIVLKGISTHELDFDFAETIFEILNKDDQDAETSYQWAMEEFKENSLHLTSEMATDFIRIMEEIAKSFDGVEPEEKKMVKKFQQEILNLVHD